MDLALSLDRRLARVALWGLAACLACGALSAGGAAAAAPAESSPPVSPDHLDLVRVWSCDFEAAEWDINYDRWPDRWTRFYDDDHPRYAEMQIERSEEAGAPAAAMVLRPDGASARLTSPPIFVIPKFSYKLRLRVKAKAVRHGEVRVQLAFCNRKDESRQIEQSQPLKANGRWEEVELGDFQPQDPDVDRVYLHFDYNRGERGDLNAEVAIADLRLYRLPSIRIETGSRYNVYTDPSEVKVTCSLSGILQQNPEVRFQLLDATNRSIGDRGQMRFDGELINQSKARASDIVDGFGSDKTSYEGAIEWRPPIHDFGFYRVRVGMFNPETGRPIGDARAITLAVVPESLPSGDGDEFGWSLPDADAPLPFDALQELLPRVGVKRVKLPVWFTPGDEQRGDAILSFSEQLAARGIDTVGVLEDPTPRLDDPMSKEPPPPIEGLFAADQSFWTPLVDHVIAKLSLRIRWWQLGRDGDTSFVGYKKLVDKVGAIRGQLFRFGQDIRMGIGWRWDHARDWPKRVTWDFEQMASRETLDAEGLGAALAAAPPATAHRWVMIEPPPVDLSAPEGADPADPNDPLTRAATVRRHERRVRDFVEQVLVAKMNDVNGVFISDPFTGSAEAADGLSGVMNRDGTPGELLLPWRTCARLLGGARYLGSIRLPQGSDNWLFLRPDGAVVMVLWNLAAEGSEPGSTPVEEALYLGEDVRVIDVWGASAEPEQRDGRQVIRVGRMPRFVYGLSEPVARWRMDANFEKSEVPSVFNVPHQNKVLFRNTFEQGVGGSMKVVVVANDPDDLMRHLDESSKWEITPNEQPIRLAAGESVESPISVKLWEAGYGEQPARLDFEVSADREYRFSVWRTLRVGLGDVTLDVATWIDDDGRLIVEQRMTKSTGDPVDFNCVLKVNGRRRKRTQVFQLGPEVDKKRFTYVRPEELVGQEMRLRIEEIDGERVLNHRFLVEPRSAPVEIAEEAEAPPEGLARLSTSR